MSMLAGLILNFGGANPASLKLTSPDGGEELIQGSIQKIRWTASGIDNVAIAVNNTSTNEGMHMIALSVPALSDSYSWEAGSTLTDGTMPVGSKYKITVYDPKNPAIQDSSDGYFKIVLGGSETGTLAINRDVSSPGKGIFYAGEVAMLAVFKITAGSYEDLDLDSLAISIAGSKNIEAVYLYKDSAIIGQAPAGPSAVMRFKDGVVVIPKNGSIQLVVKAKISGKDFIKDEDIVSAELKVYDSVRTTGIKTGKYVNSAGQQAAGSRMTVFRSR